MEGFMQIWRHRIFGIPVSIIALAISAVVLYLVIKKVKSNATPPTPADNSTTDTGNAAGPSGDSGPFTVEQPTFEANPDNLTDTSQDNMPTTENTAITTNEEWKRAAITWLMSAAGGSYSLQIATDSITNYLNGRPATTQEATARDKAIANFGLPPGAVPGNIKPSTNPNPVPSGPAKRQGTPPLLHTVEGSNDNTARELAYLYYGTNDKQSTDRIESVNLGIGQPYPVGSKIHVPSNVVPKYYDATAATNNQFTIAKKNGTSAGAIETLNPSLHFPVKAGTRVRVK